MGFARHLGVVSVPRHEGAGEGPGWRLSGAAFLAPRSFSTCLSKDGSPVLDQLGRLVALGPHGLRPLFSRTQGSTRSLPLGPIRESSPRGTVRDSRPLDHGPLVPSTAGASSRHVLFQASECVLAADACSRCCAVPAKPYDAVINPWKCVLSIENHLSLNDHTVPGARKARCTFHTMAGDPGPLVGWLKSRWKGRGFSSRARLPAEPHAQR